jgi:glycosyltransferase involved in cell wall biosynthesis
MIQVGEVFQLDIQHTMLHKNPHQTQIVLAALNEEQGIAYTIAELKTIFDNPKIIVVDGNSNDKTAVVAQALGARVIQQIGRGKGDAINIGLKSIDPQTNYVIISDADFTYPAKYIPQMIDILDQNPQIGMVCGNRFNEVYSLKAMNDIFYFGNKLISMTHSILNGINLTDPLTGLRVIRADLLRDWTPLSKDFDIEVELNNHMEKSGFKTVEIPILYRTRIGEKKLKMKHGRIILQRIIKEFFR